MVFDCTFSAVVETKCTAALYNAYFFGHAIFYGLILCLIYRDLAAWLYADNVDPDRQAILASPTSFEELVALAKGDICQIRLRVQPGHEPGLTHCLQPAFAFELPTVGDRLPVRFARCLTTDRRNEKAPTLPPALESNDVF